MTDYKLPASATEAAGRKLPNVESDVEVEEALRAAFEELEMRVEVAAEPEVHSSRISGLWRYHSRWMPVEEP